MPLNSDGTFGIKELSKELIGKAVHFLSTKMGKPLILVEMPGQPDILFYAANYQQPSHGISMTLNIGSGTILNDWIQRKAGTWRLNQSNGYPEDSQKIDSELISLPTVAMEFYSKDLNFTVYLP